jgi:hypothetical protein
MQLLLSAPRGNALGFERKKPFPQTLQTFASLCDDGHIGVAMIQWHQMLMVVALAVVGGGGCATPSIEYRT